MRRTGFSPVLTLLIPGFSLPKAPESLVGTPSAPRGRSPTTPDQKSEVRGFGGGHSPAYFRRRTPRPVSYYALFEGWLLLSQPPGCLGNPTSLTTKSTLGTLAGGLGCYPLDNGAYPSLSHSRVWSTGLGGLVGVSKLTPPYPSRALPPAALTRGCP